MPAHPNSTRAYIKKVLSPGGCKAQRDKCFKAVLDNHPTPLNNRMIKNLTRLEINIVSPRVNSLVVPPPKDPDREMPLKDLGTWKDKVTGYETRFVGLNGEYEPRTIQFEMSI